MNPLLSLAVNTAFEAGKTLKKYYGNVKIEGSKTEQASDVVTKLDGETENFIAKKFQEYDSSIGFVGEEFGERSRPNRYWLVDPIDGTGHFARGNPFCTTMIALIENGEVVLSVIYNFATNQMYSAEKGKGAFLNAKEIHVSNKSLKESYLSVETHLDVPENAGKFIKLRGKCTFFSSVNCGYEFGLIAEGKLDGRICFDPYAKDWDFAPGTLLVSEAGGIVRNIGKTTYDFTNHDFIATNPIVYNELINSSIF